MKRYYIVGNQAFESVGEAKEYCNSNCIVESAIIETQTSKTRFYELQTKGANSIYYNIFLTDQQLCESEWIKEIEFIKSNEYYGTFIHLKEISEREYRKWCN